MDRVIAQLTEFCTAIDFDALPANVVDAAVERLVDTVGCAIGGLDCEAVRIGRQVSPKATPTGTALVGRALGDVDVALTLEEAGFLNSAMIRYLDFNDTFPGGHPSDALGPVIALADALGSPGERLVTALVAGYELFIRFCVAAELREKGWDQGFGIALATAAGASILLDLDQERTSHALSIAAVANVPLRATRAGELSLWKGTATSYAAAGALWTTLLAGAGMSGPTAPVDGRHGLKELVTGEFELPPFRLAEDDFLIRQARIKYWPVEYHLQAAVWCGIELGKKLAESEVEAVEIETYWSAWHETGSEPAKWDPRTRETADHSMPYVFARAFQAGVLDLTAFEESQYLDPRVRDFMSKVSVRVEGDLQGEFPHVIRMRATARSTSQESFHVEVVNPRGHEENPVTPEEVGQKFLRLAVPVYGEQRAVSVLAGWRNAAKAASVRDLVDLLVLDRLAGS